MKISSLVVQGFRGFNRNQTFSLGDVNILGGPNGFGKTSFFDAVLWCLFESIPRLSGTRDFVKAGNIVPNKFSKGPCFVELTFGTPEGDLCLRRDLTQFVSRIGKKKLGQLEALERLGLQDGDAISRFQRNFLLQQDSVNEFVRDLNPRGRYDSMVSMLEIREPTALGVQLDALGGILARERDSALRALSVAEQRLTALRVDIAEMQKLGTSVSMEAAERRYEAILRDAGTDLIAKLKVRLGKEQEKPLRERILALVGGTTDAQATIRDINSDFEAMGRLTEEIGRVAGEATIKAELSRRNAGLERAEHSLERVERDLAASQAKVKTQKSKVDTALKIHDRVRAVLTEVRSIINSDVCPVCQRPMKRDKLLEILQSEIGTSGTETGTLIEELNHRQAVHRKLELQAQRLDDAIRQRSAIVEDLRLTLENLRKLNSLTRKLKSSLSVQHWELFSEDADVFSANLSRTQAEVENVRRGSVELMETLEKLDSTALLPAKIAEEKKISANAGRARAVFVSWNGKISTVQRCKDALSRAQMGLLTATFDLHRPLIRSLYQRMHPHPLFTDIGFEFGRAHGEGELYFKVFTPEGSVEAYPSTVFSASQLNVLAVAVFLALNLRIESPIPLMMLDDPIHSMDDLNILGFCDVVRQMKDTRQLFISTHSKDLYGLLLNKLRPANASESLRGFWFADWSDLGPTIREQVAEFVPDSVDWASVDEVVGIRPR